MKRTHEKTARIAAYEAAMSGPRTAIGAGLARQPIRVHDGTVVVPSGVAINQ